MPTKRQRPNGSWEFTVKRKNILPKPISMTFDVESEGDEYCARLEALLDQGIVPEEYSGIVERVETLSDLLRSYEKAVSLSIADKEQIPVAKARLAKVSVMDVNYRWVEDWIASMKRELGLSPSTIRKHVGLLGRCLDWAGKRYAQFAVNPIRLLPKKYASYNPEDARMAELNGHKAKQDSERDRRLEDGEEKSIREILNGKKPEGRERTFNLPYQGAIECVFDLALESAMRMREMYTLTLDQIDFEKRTIFLDKTKNGDKRQVPLTTVAERVLRTYLAQVDAGERNMAGFKHELGRVFPWWDGVTVESEKLRPVTTRLSQQYARVFEAAGCPDVRFHDLRHEATSRIFERTTLTDVQISRITGHKDPRILRRYSNLRGSDLAVKLW